MEIKEPDLKPAPKPKHPDSTAIAATASHKMYPSNRKETQTDDAKHTNTNEPLMDRLDDILETFESPKHSGQLLASAQSNKAAGAGAAAAAAAGSAATDDAGAGIAKASSISDPSSISTTDSHGSGSGASGDNKLPMEVGGSILPGCLASVAVMGTGFYCAEQLGSLVLAAQGLNPAGPSPISGIPVSILLGAIARQALKQSNNTGLIHKITPGLEFCTTSVLRLGIVCVGFKLQASEMMALGLTGIPAVVTAITVGVSSVMFLGSRFGLPIRLTSLIAAGTSICGITAITALAPVIKANQKEVSYAVANVVLFGTTAMITYPYLANALFTYSEQVGIFLGLSIHDTSQVMASALTYKEIFADEIALKMAAVTKLTRNVFLAVVIPLLAIRTNMSDENNNRGDHSNQGKSNSMKGIIRKCLPLFVVGFILAACVRSGGDAMLEMDMKAYGIFEEKDWKDLNKFVGNTVGGRYLLGTAMAGVGLSTDLAIFKKGTLGLRPFIVGSAGAMIVGSTSICTLMLLENLGKFKQKKPEV
mmetsp:Transcript_3449/g.6432  ORF Transcript_3449/g.6432 Transcript_3449/m.6432 type:complete len:534 (+) Transcript_3449:1166-2767(+)